MNKIQIIVLAAGHGKRMKNGELPKVLVLLKDKPMINWLLEAVKKSNVCEKPVLVVGQKAEMVKAELGSNYKYILQTEQLGTGHAVAATRAELEGVVTDIMVLYGDHPTVSASTISNLAKTHLRSKTVLTMATVNVDDFDDWRQSFVDYGRIIRNQRGSIIQIIEKRDANEQQQQITEINPGYYCFKAEWLWHSLDQLQNNNTQHEYYLTDLIEIACRQSQEIASVAIDAHEALGANTPEQLALINQIF